MRLTMDAVPRYLLEHCGGLQAGQGFLLISDSTTAALVPEFLAAAYALRARVQHVETAVTMQHGVEPDATVLDAMQKADLVVALTLKSLAHTRARQALSARGGRFLSLPGYDAVLLQDPAVTVDYHAQYARTRAFADAFSAGRRVRVATRAGTNITLNIAGRTGNCCPGFVNADHGLGSPPDIEANVSPVETDAEGVVVVDGSVACAEIGLLLQPLRLTVSGGRITRFESDNMETVEICQALFSRVGDAKAYVLAECGVGLNPAARLTGNMLTDEGVLGCVHFGFGSNATVGGLNDVPFHLDFVFRSASLWVDDEPWLLDGVPTKG